VTIMSYYHHHQWISRSRPSNIYTSHKQYQCFH